MSALQKPFFTPEQYLELERKADHKSEYLSGEIFAMAGGSPAHALITCNISAEMHAQLKGRPCNVYSPDLRIQVSATGLYTYPDVVVVCGEAKLAGSNADNLLNPAVIFEVLSPSSESYDRGEKFAHYRRLESLTEYVLVSQDKVLVERYIRQANGDWLLHAVDSPDESITLPSLDCRLALSEIYSQVQFEHPAPTADSQS